MFRSNQQLFKIIFDMKKNLTRILLLTITATIGFHYGCDKSKIDLSPHGPTEAVYFSTEGEFTKAVLGVYAKMTDLYGRVTVSGAAGPGNSLMPLYLAPGDDITTNNTGEEFEIFSNLQPTSARINDFYRTLYQIIARA